MWTLENWQKHIQMFRIMLGIYLCFHFLHMIPWSFEMFGHGQILTNIKLNLSYSVFPNILALFNTSQTAIVAFLFSLALSSILLTFNRYPVFQCVYLWYGWCCLFNGNNLILNPTLQYIGWLLLALALILKNPEKIRSELHLGAWVLLAVGYSISGIAKFLSPSWQDGSALLHVINNPLARDYFLRDQLTAMPPIVLSVGSYFVLALEILFLPLCLFTRTRFVVWMLMILCHIGILFIVNFTDLTLGMLLVHFFVVDYRWFKDLKLRGKYGPALDLVRSNFHKSRS